MFEAISKYPKLKLMYFLFLTCCQAFALKFDQEVSGEDVTITVHDDDDIEVGFASYRKIIPVVPWYAIHSLYIHPEFRRKGYGSAIVTHICTLLKEAKASRAYIQPGPFEFQDGKPLSVGNMYKQKMRELVAFYTELGFKPVSPSMATIAAIFYFFSGIHEDSHYLMMKLL